MDIQNKDYEDFISTVSHELRTPLTSIRGFSQTMLQSWDKLDDESKKRFLKIIEEQSNRLIGLVENMLSVTKLQSSKDNFIYSQTDIKPLIEQTISIVKSQYKNKSFELNFNKNVPLIFTDSNKFQQVMTNLIENAAKYSDENTVVEIFVSLADDCNGVSIKISDIGIKIEEKDYEKIFNKFSRIDNPLTRKVQGSGLGLYITKNIIKKMNGEITVSSNGNKTIFEVILPVGNVEDYARAKCSQ